MTSLFLVAIGFFAFTLAVKYLPIFPEKKTAEVLNSGT
jgi:hypothetical protein